MHFDLHNIGDRLQKKLGPLPVWAWALIIVGVGYGVYHYTIGKNVGSASDTPTDAVASDATPLDTSLLPPASSGSGVGGGYAPDTGPGTTYVPPITFPFDNSADVGLASFGLGASDASIVDNPQPSLAQASVSAMPNLVLPKNPTPAQTAVNKTAQLAVQSVADHANAQLAGIAVGNTGGDVLAAAQKQAAAVAAQQAAINAQAAAQKAAAAKVAAQAAAAAAAVAAAKKKK